MIVAVLQARISSSRLPGKVLLPVLGKPMLIRQAQRVLRAESVDRLVVATSDTAPDDPIETACRAEGVDCFRGDLSDVLDRFYRCACSCGARHVVRLTGDCPLADPAVIDRVVELHLAGAFAYTSNVVTRSFPDGLDVEVIAMNALEQSWRQAHRQDCREHVTAFVRRQPARFKTGSFVGPIDVFQMRWTVDEREDYEFVRSVFETLYPANPHFTWMDVLRLVEDRADIARINADCGDDVNKLNRCRITDRKCA